VDPVYLCTRSSTLCHGEIHAFVWSITCAHFKLLAIDIVPCSRITNCFLFNNPAIVQNQFITSKSHRATPAVVTRGKNSSCKLTEKHTAKDKARRLQTGGHRGTLSVLTTSTVQQKFSTSQGHHNRKRNRLSRDKQRHVPHDNSWRNFCNSLFLLRSTPL
jgi:hypothetical protein